MAGHQPILGSRCLSQQSKHGCALAAEKDALYSTVKVLREVTLDRLFPSQKNEKEIRINTTPCCAEVKCFSRKISPLFLEASLFSTTVI
jgi:hypothetical protein